MDPEVTETRGQFHAALIADHAALEATLKTFCAELRRGRGDVVVALWRRIESDLGAHLRAEEQHILPIFERAYPHHGALIRRHHDQLRKALECMSVDLSRSKLEEVAVAKLIEVLRHHARHEEVVFYYWARLHLDHNDARRVVGQLRAAAPRRDGTFP